MLARFFRVGVRGPVLLAAFRRLAALCFSEAISLPLRRPTSPPSTPPRAAAGRALQNDARAPSGKPATAFVPRRFLVQFAPGIFGIAERLPPRRHPQHSPPRQICS